MSHLKTTFFVQGSPGTPDNVAFSYKVRLVLLLIGHCRVNHYLNEKNVVVRRQAFLLILLWRGSLAHSFAIEYQIVQVNLTVLLTHCLFQVSGKSAAYLVVKVYTPSQLSAGGFSMKYLTRSA